MAEKKEKKFVKPQQTTTTTKTATKETAPFETPVAAPQGKTATGTRVLAGLFWLLGIVLEVVGVLIIFNKITVNSEQTVIWAIGAFVLDIICLVVGAHIWKHANEVAPANESDSFKFWLWNQMGIIVACGAFIPVVIVVLVNNQLDKKCKQYGSIAAVIAVVIIALATIIL